MISMPVATWSEYKALVSSKKLLIQYSQLESKYLLVAIEGQALAWTISLLQDEGEDVSDFENNFKSAANKPIEVKAASNRPPRVSASPQPDSTTERWKGYEIDCTSEDASKAIDISFGALIYLRGGMIYSKDVTNGDKAKVEIQTQIGGVWTTIMTPMEDLFLVNGMRMEVVSPECMEFATTLRLKVTFTPAATGTAKKVYLVLDYYA